MRRLAFGVAGVLASVGMLWGSVTPAAACSVGPDFNPVTESDVIVGGRITGWELIENFERLDPKTRQVPVDDPNYYGPYDPIRAFMIVDRVYKGDVPGQIDLVAGNTLWASGGAYSWVGASGACGAFDTDPTGQYWIMGLRIDEFGRYRPSRPLTFYVGAEPTGDSYEQALAMMSAFGAVVLPVGGGPPSTPSAPAFPTLPGAVALMLVLLAFLLGASFVWRRGA